jgi:hypothetical protein
MPNIPVDSPFGHLGEKYIFLMYRLQYTNDTVKELYDLQSNYHEKFSNKIYLEDCHYKICHRVLRFLSEIKMVTDEMISFLYILEYYKTNNEWPKKIAIDCISKYLSVNNKLDFQLPKDSRPFLNKINTLGNAVKHTFVNSEVLWKRSKNATPILIAYHQPNNDSSQPVQFEVTELPDFITKFNSFLEDFRNIIRIQYPAVQNL